MRACTSEGRLFKNLVWLAIAVELNVENSIGDYLPVLDDSICGVHYSAVHVEEYTGKCKYF